jgi:hypothetical protein
MSLVARFRKDADAAVSARGIIGIGVSILVLAAFLPAAFDSFFNASTDGWSTAAAVLWPVIPLVVLAALLLAFLGRDD